jgi:hypothetical protein
VKVFFSCSLCTVFPARVLFCVLRHLKIKVKNAVMKNLLGIFTFGVLVFIFVETLHSEICTFIDSVSKRKNCQTSGRSLVLNLK